MRPEQWIVGSDTGISSTTIWAVMMGVTVERPSPPRDADDFGRCSRLLAAIPAWRPRLHEVAAAHPEWRDLVERWDEIEALYRAELARDDGFAPETCALIRELTRDVR